MSPSSDAAPVAAPPHTGHGAAQEPGLAHFPVTFFATTMGLCGFTLATHAVERAAGTGPFASQILLWATAAVFVLTCVFYGLKGLRHPGAVAAEWHHPVRLAFFPTFSISLLLLAVAFLGQAPGLAQVLWIAGAGLQGVLTLAVISGWIGTRSFQHGHLSPAWFIPAVGNVVVPVAGVPLGYGDIAWVFFSAGLVFWVVLLTLVFNRLVFHDPLPGRLQPTLVILIAPPAVAYLAWTRLMAEAFAGGGDSIGAAADPFGQILLSLGYAFAAIVAVQLPRILRLPFALSFWALSFPMAALTIASFLSAERSGVAGYRLVGFGLYALLAALIAALVWRTVIAIFRGEICRPE